MQTHKDYRVNMVSNLIIDLKDMNYKIRPLDMAEKIVSLMDNIYGMEYKNKIDYHINDYKNFHGTKV